MIAVDDLPYLAGLAGFFGMMVFYLAGCARLGRDADAAAPGDAAAARGERRP